MVLAKRIFEQTSFEVLQQAQKFVFATIANVLVINILPREEYGLLGLAMGYFVFLLWLSLSPESILAQRYQQIKNDDPKKYVSMLYTFILVRTAGVTLVACLFAVVIFVMTASVLAAVVFVAYTFVQMLLLMSGSLQYILKMEFQQKSITRWSFALGALQVSLLLMLFVFPGVLLYLCVLGFVAALEVIVWTSVLKRVQPFLMWYTWADTWLELWKNIKSYSLWQHLVNNLTKYMYEIDIVFLALVAPLTVVGNYAISLKIVNFGFILPSILQMGLVLTISRLTEVKDIVRATNLFLKYSIALGLLQLLAFFVLAKWYILLHTRTYVDEIYVYAVIIFVAVTILNMARPLIAYIITRTDLRRFFLFSVLPAATVSSIVYPLSAYWYGAIGIAVANIICYGFWVLTMVWYIWRVQPFRFEWIWLDERERNLLQSIKDRFL